MKKFLAVVLEMTMKPLAKITFSCKRMARHGIAFPFCAVIGLAALSSLNCVAFGQPFSGPGVFSGNTQIGAPGGGGAPLTYSARTDGCVNPTATPSSCIGGTTTGQAGATLLFQEGINDPIPAGFAATIINSGTCPSGLTPASYPAYCPAPMNTIATDPDFGSTLVMASDDYLVNNGSPWLVSENAGSTTFSADETLMTMGGSNGSATIVNVSAASIHAKTCATSPCVNRTGIVYAGSGGGDSTHLAHGSNITFSSKPGEPHTAYEQLGTLVNRLVVNSSIASPGTATLTRTAYVDFSKDIATGGPVDCGVLPPITVGANTSVYANSWTSVFNVALDGSVGYGMTGGYDWLPSWTPADVIGNTIFIHPVSNNATNHGFQATTISGPTGATEPNWDSSCATTCTDGGVTWTNIGVLQGQGPGFDIVNYRPPGTSSPGCSRMNTRLGKIYRGTGNSAPAGAITTNDPVACTRTLGAPCGTGVTVNLPEEFTLHGSPQMMNGDYMRLGPTGGESLNPPGSWNSGTLTCQPNGASDVWAGAWNDTTTYTNKQTVSYTDGTSAYYVRNSTSDGGTHPVPRTGGVVNATYWTQQEAFCAHYYWNTPTTLVIPTTAWAAVGGHSCLRYLYDYYGGRYTAGLISAPSAQLSPPNGPITVNPGTNLLSTPFPADDHSSGWNAGTQDLQPVLAVIGDVPSSPTDYTSACYDEVCAVGVGGSGPLYRFAHTYNTGNNSTYPTQDTLGNVSPQGDLIAISTDMMGTRGDDTIGSTQCQNNRGMLKATAGMTLNLNDTVFPIASNAGTYVYQATVGGVTSGGAPTGGWCQTQGCTATWGAATVQNIGANTCRGDVLIVDLLSAHPAPTPSGPSWTGILSTSRAIDWSGAGVIGGIPSGSWTQCGSTIAAGASSTTIQNAINACTANHYVLLGAGNFPGLTGLVMKTGVELRGSGANQTFLTFTTATSCNGSNVGICFLGDTIYYGSSSIQPGQSNAATWTAGYAQGSTSITLSSVGSAGVHNGDYIMLDQANDTSVASGYLVCDVAGTCSLEGGGLGRTVGGVTRGQLQIVKVVSGCASACTGAGPFPLTITPGIYPPNIASGKSPGAWFGSQITNAGIRNFAIDTSAIVDPGNDRKGIQFAMANNCWVQGVRHVRNSTGTTSGSARRSFIELQTTAHTTITDNYFYANTAGSSVNYSIEQQLASDNLIQNNIVQLAGPILNLSTGSVVAYNFILDIPSSPTNFRAGGIQEHDAGPSMNLSEGNITPGFISDAFHGSSNMWTLYRNYEIGTDTGKGQNRSAMQLWSFNRYHNVIANVLGASGFTTYTQDPGGQNSDLAIYAVGDGDGLANDSLVQATMMRWGNYDTVNAAARWVGGEVPSGISPYPNPVPTTGCTASITCPPSFYLSSKPSWFKTLTWPGIGPEVTGGNIANVGGHAYQNPAMNCALNVMGMPSDGSGSALTFDPASCY